MKGNEKGTERKGERKGDGHVYLPAFSHAWFSPRLRPVGVPLGVPGFAHRFKAPAPVVAAGGHADVTSPPTPAGPRCPDSRLALPRGRPASHRFAPPPIPPPSRPGSPRPASPP